MKRSMIFLLGLSTLFSFAFATTKTENKRPIETEAVSNTRLYVVVNDDIKARAPAYKLYNGSSDENLALLSTVDSRHEGDIYTYYTDSPGTGWKTFKNNGGSSINLYNIDPSGYGTTWDMITFNSPTTVWNGVASIVKSIYTAPIVGETYTVTLYNGESVVGTQTAYEDIEFVPAAVPVNDYTFHGWYTDAALTIAYSPVVLTEATSLYGKYLPIDLDYSHRLYINSTNSWWYDSSARIDIYYWKTGVTAEVQTMRKETGNLHSVVLPNASYTYIKLERKNPVSPYNVWNATGDISVSLSTYDVTYLSGPLNGGYTGPMTASEYSSTAPDIVFLKTQVPLLTCSNYSEADNLLAAFNRLGDNEMTIIEAESVLSHDEVSLSYQTVIDYYVGWKAANATPPAVLSVIEREKGTLWAAVVFLSAFGVASSLFFAILRKKRIA